MSTIIEKYLLDDSPLIPVGTILTAGLDASAVPAVWVLHDFPVDTTQLMTVWAVQTDTEITRAGTWIATFVSGTDDMHVYTSGPISA